MVIGLHVVGAVLGIAVLVWSVWPLHRRLWFDTHSNRSAMGGLLDQIDDPARDLLRLTRAIKRGKADRAASIARDMGRLGLAYLGVGHRVTQPGTNRHRELSDYVPVPSGRLVVVYDPNDHRVLGMQPLRGRKGGGVA